MILDGEQDSIHTYTSSIEHITDKLNLSAMAAGTFSLAFLLLLVALQAASQESPYYNPDINLNTPQTIRRHGYPVEAHTVETEDGYILTMHRIPGGRFHTAAAKEAVEATSTTINTTTTLFAPTPTAPTRTRPVLLHHGLLGTSYAWILTGPGKGLAYLLADAGYDVWLANARGNPYSRAHTNLPTDSHSPFWNFSFHEIGMYDLPAEIDYILQKSGSSQLDYIGHSMGTTAFFVLASTKPEAAAKIASSLSLAPVAFMRHIKSPIRLLAPFARDFEYLVHLLGEGELQPHSKILKHLAEYGCKLLPIDKTICDDMVFIICGYDDAQFDKSLLPLMNSHSSSGTPTQSIIHYAQMLNTGKFQQFDYGPTVNLKKYNSTVPPEYDLSKVNVPVHLYYAKNDWLSSVTDVSTLYNDLVCEKTEYLVPLDSFNHLDYILAKDAKKLLYDKILKQLHREEYNPIEVL